MGRTACTEPQWLYKGALYFIDCIIVNIPSSNQNKDPEIGMSM